MAGVIVIDGAFVVDPHDVEYQQVPALPEVEGRWLVPLVPAQASREGESSVLLSFPAADTEWTVPLADEGPVEVDLRWQSLRSDLNPHWSFRADGVDRRPTGAARPELNFEAEAGLRDVAGARVYCASNDCRQRSLRSKRPPPLVARIVRVVFPLAGFQDSDVFAPPELLLVVTHESQAPRGASPSGANRGRVAPAMLAEPLVVRLAPTEIICKRCHRRGHVRQVSRGQGG